MKLDKKIAEEITDILDNVTYWETCPEEYKQKIPLLIRALNMHIVIRQSEQLKDGHKNSFKY